MWSSLNLYERIGLVFILLGSIVDIVQFSWIIKKALSKYKVVLYNKVRKDILLSQYNKVSISRDTMDAARDPDFVQKTKARMKQFEKEIQEDLDSQGEYGKDSFPGIRGDE